MKIKNKNAKIKKKFKISFEKNFSLNDVFLLEIIIFEEEPLSWSKIMWINTNKVNTKGNKKCKEKNIVRVGDLTEKSPHIHNTRLMLITLNKLVITVPPQRDIWPQGNT